MIDRVPPCSGGVPMRLHLVSAFVFAVSVAGLLPSTGRTSAAAPAIPSRGHHLAMGLPSPAKPDASQPDDYLERKAYFGLSYNNSKGTPNWVSWNLAPGFLGTAPRKSKFDTDD